MGVAHVLCRIDKRDRPFPRLATQFLEIERVRFGDRLRVDAGSSAASTWLVPPLLLQPLVENAVTHGVAHVIEGGVIRIAISSTDSSLTIDVENPCDPERPRRTGTGLGLSNVRGRLEAIYGNHARVTAGETDGAWKVRLSLPADGSPSLASGDRSHD